MGIKHTGVYATYAEYKELNRLALKHKRAWNHNYLIRPVYCLYKLNSLKDINIKCHDIALLHNLKEHIGYYGITVDGEFVRME